MFGWHNVIKLDIALFIKLIQCKQSNHIIEIMYCCLLDFQRQQRAMAARANQWLHKILCSLTFKWLQKIFYILSINLAVHLLFANIIWKYTYKHIHNSDLKEIKVLKVVM